LTSKKRSAVKALTVSAAVATSVAIVASLVGATPAAAATCSSPVRYAASSDTIYLGSGSVDTLTEIKAACPAAPLVLVKPGVWELNADLVLQGGAKLTLDGGKDVKELHLQSLPSGLQKDVSAITAQYGQIDIRGVKVTSWNGTGPDMDDAIPSGGVRGRAFIRAISFMDGDKPRQSTMNIVDSDLGYLGYNAAESYGVAYKARGCGLNTQKVCAKLKVSGKQTGSQFHHNYMGTYTWGAKKMVFDGNTYEHNKDYGLDPHDDSDYLKITNNTFSENGNHGLICAERCDHLTITGNKSIDNGHTPYSGSDEDGDASNNLVHGIMLYRGITDSVIEDNVVSGQINGGGIAIFDSVGNTVKNNTITGNEFGLRFSVGTKNTRVSGNKIEGSAVNALSVFKGADKPQYTGTSGRPSGITFTDNTFNGAGAAVLSVQDADSLTFTGGSITPGAPTRGPSFVRAKSQVVNKSVAIPAGTTFVLRGTSALKTTVTFKGIKAAAVTIDKDAFSTATFK
jgi:parallel beta-helix repeat protein